MIELHSKLVNWATDNEFDEKYDVATFFCAFVHMFFTTMAIKGVMEAISKGDMTMLLCIVGTLLPSILFAALVVLETIGGYTVKRITSKWPDLIFLSGGKPCVKFGAAQSLFILCVAGLALFQWWAVAIVAAVVLYEVTVRVARSAYVLNGKLKSHIKNKEAHR